MHYYDPHAPYEPPAQFAAAATGKAEGGGRRADTTGQRYDGEVAYVDAELRRLLDALSSRGLLSNTIIVVAGDHGESLGEHGERTHGMLLYESAVRVPLIVKAPGIKPAVRTDPASLADIAPTILGTRTRGAGAAGPVRGAGRPRAPACTQGADGRRGPARRPADRRP